MVRDTGTEALARLAGERVDHRFKGLPPDADGLTVTELAAQRRNLFTGGFTTPVLALSAERLELKLAGKLDDAAGVVWGECEDCHPNDYKPSFQSTFSLGEIVDQIQEYILRAQNLVAEKILE